MRSLQIGSSSPQFAYPQIPCFRSSRIFPASSNPNRKLRASAGKGFSSSAPPREISKNSSSNNNNDDDDKIPQVVFERMTVRIVAFVGVPLVTGLVLFHYLGVVREQRLWEVPLWLPFVTGLATFGASTLGVAYGSLSTSWDADRKGSLMGFEEAQRNWVEVWKEENE